VVDRVEVAVRPQIGKAETMRFNLRSIAGPSLAAVFALGMVAPLYAQHADTLRGPVMTHAAPPVERGVAAFPRVDASPAVSPAIAAKINASLLRLDNTVRGAAADCRDQFQENKNQRSVDGWKRSVKVTMKGPAFFSVEAADSWYCGGAYPDASQLPMVYDLTTGKPLDWLTVLPADAKGDTDQAGDGTTVGLVMWKPLRKMAIDRASEECREVLTDQESMRFALSLDGRTGTLVATLFGLPHAVAACEEPIQLNAALAKQMGVSSRVTDALQAAATLQH
jgi:hypothetical protein